MPIIVHAEQVSLPPIIGGWDLFVSRVYCVFTRFLGVFLDLGEHHLLIVAYSSIVC